MFFRKKKAKQDFAAAAGTAGYAFDYPAEVTAFYQANPEYKGKIFFFDVLARQLVLEAGGKMNEFEQLLVLRAQRDLEVCHAGGYSMAMPLREVNGGMAFINPEAARKDLPALLGHHASAGVEAAFIFDHEIAHVTCRDGISTSSRFGSRNLYECVADGYAAIRHIQRFGGVTPHLKQLVDIRTVELVFRAGTGALAGSDDGGHYTAPAIERIIADSKTVDFSKLSPEETRAVARRYALEYAMTQASLSYTSEAFLGFKGRLPEMTEGKFDILRQLGQFVLATNDPAVLRTGAAALRAVMDGKVRCNGQRILPQGKEWMELRKSLALREALLEKQGPVMFGIVSARAKAHTPPQP